MDDALDIIEQRHQNAPCIYSIVDCHTDEVVGTTGLTEHWPERERAKMGRTLIHPDKWGQGVNYEAKITLLDWLFSVGVGVGRVEADVDSTNTNSIRSLLSCGFTLEGTRRRSVKSPDGMWKDITVFSMLIEEWPVKRSELIHVMAERQRGTQPVAECPSVV